MFVLFVAGREGGERVVGEGLRLEGRGGETADIKDKNERITASVLANLQQYLAGRPTATTPFSPRSKVDDKLLRRRLVGVGVGRVAGIMEKM